MASKDTSSSSLESSSTCSSREKRAMKLCGHCNKFVSRTTFYAHKRLYFDRKEKKWSRTRFLYHDHDAAALDDDKMIQDETEEPDEEKLEYSYMGDNFFQDLEMTEGHESDGHDADDCGDGNLLEDTGEDTIEKEANDDCSMEVWQDIEDEIMDDDDDSPHNDHSRQGSEEEKKLVRLYAFFLLMFQGTFRISDAAINVLLTFFSLFFAAVYRILVPSHIRGTTVTLLNLPKSKKDAYLIGNCGNDFKKYVCCPSCHNIYSRDECVVRDSQGKAISKLCSFKRYPHHPQPHHRRECGQQLMKQVKSMKGIISFQPRLVYCYSSVISSLKELLSRPGFIDDCESWRNRVVLDNVFMDVYDGKVWQDFMVVDGQNFLASPFNFAFQLNADWFQPFTHTRHSEGAIYLSILNLPRQKRFSKENILLVGVIPGPKEPELHMNSFLKPLVDDLSQLWKGVYIKVNSLTHLVRAAVLCVGCDIPAARKVCGFLGHRATLGCSKCLLQFPTEKFGEKADYSNFNRAKDWTPRTADDHRNKVEEVVKCKTKSDQMKCERNFGVRYSCLLELAYFDPPRMCVIDPMHNLLLGTSKLMIELWKSSKILSDAHFDIIQSRVDSFVCPIEIGRIPSKISSSFSGFTAEQWKNWTIYFSSYALKGILPWNHYNCWLLFVKACWLFCRRTITLAALKEADHLILEFCEKCVEIYGPEMCTMNMHLHGHIKECVEDYGPVYSFWCFSFERLNGILGTYPTNNRNISVQLTRRFLESRLYAPINWPNEFADDYIPLLKKFEYQKGSLNQIGFSCKSTDVEVIALPPVFEAAFLTLEIDELCSLVDKDSRLFRLHERCHSVLIKFKNHSNQVIIGSEKSKHSRSSFVLYQKPTCNTITLAVIRFFAKCVYIIDGKSESILWVAALSPYMDHQCKVWFGKPTEVWSTTTYPGYEFVPITYIKSRVLYSRSVVNFGQVIGDQVVNVIVRYT